MLQSSNHQTSPSMVQPLMAFVMRQWHLSRRYMAWELVFLFYAIINTLTIGLIAVGMGQKGQKVDDQYILYLVIGAMMWSFLGVIFREISESIAWERWEGTIEQTFMAPIDRLTHLLGLSLYTVLYGTVRTILILMAVIFFFGIEAPQANYGAALLVLLASSASFLGLGLIAAVLPLISPEKGAQATHIMEGLLLLVSGIYYPISALPEWLQPLAWFSPATYTLEGVRRAILEGATAFELLPVIGSVAVMAIVLVPLGLGVFSLAERYAKQVGLLKRNG